MKTKYYLLFVFYLCLTSFDAFSQFGNEWINYNQKYYAFDVVQHRVYRINQSTIANLGVNTSSFSSANIQIFGKEREIPIHIVDGGDNSFDSGDYILFYGERNNGWLDSTLYSDPNTIGSPSLSLYNDTLTYFFTWNNSNNNLRYQVETDVNFSSYIPTPYIFSTYEKDFQHSYYEGERVGDASSSFFVEGEGWGNSAINGASGGATQNINLPTPNVYTGAGAPDVFVRGNSVSNSNPTLSPSGFNHHVRWRIGASQTVIKDETFYGYKQIRFQNNISPTLLNNGNTPLYFQVIGDLGVTTDYQAATYFFIEYPMIPDFQNWGMRRFYIENNLSQSKVRIDVSNVSLNNPVVFAMGDIPRMIPFVNASGANSMLIPNSLNGNKQYVVFANEPEISEITQLYKVGENAQFTDYTSGLMDSTLLLVFNKKLQSASEEYAEYRRSPQGGNYSVILADVDELYFQFGGGIKKHINGIRRFANFIDHQTSSGLAGLFLMGKGFREAKLNSFTSDGPGYRFDPARYELCLIPSFGHPSSDVAITSSLQNNNWVPICPTGRISVRTNQELQDYLNKVKQYEIQQNPTDIYTTPNKAWQKEIIHFGGGSDEAQQNIFQASLNSFKIIAEDSLFGGEVFDVFKSSSNPLDPTVLDGVTSKIESGVSVMTYFGHSSSTTSGFEVNLDEPSNWNNTGKYPLMIVNSCYNGNLFQLTPSKSEEFVRVPNFGAIGYISSTSTGYSHSLAHYTRDLYREFSSLSYGKPIGFNMMKAIQSQQNTYGYSLYHETTTSQMVLNGDPMISVNSHQRPEIELTPQNVWFTPEDLNLTVDSIEVHIVLTNLGHSITDSFSLEIIRNFPNGADSVYRFQIEELHFKDTFSFKMPLQANIGLGINNFKISADIPSFIPEQYEEINNNQVNVPLFLNVDGIIPVIPYDFAVVPYDTVTVKASTINPIAGTQTYLFQIDTTDLYNSSEFRQFSMSSTGGVQEVHWSDWLTSSGVNSPLTCQDSTVYFWRVALDSSTPEWREFSFQYIPNKEGWGQDHFYQFKKNDFNDISYERSVRKRLFAPATKEVSVTLTNQSTSFSDLISTAWYIEDEQQDYAICTFTPQIILGVVDPLTFKAWTTLTPSSPDGKNLGNVNNWTSCRSRPEKYFIYFQNDSTSLANLASVLTDSIPNDYYVVLYTPITFRYDLVHSGHPIYSALSSIGAQNIIPTNSNNAFIYIAKIGDISNTLELIGSSAGESMEGTFDMSGFDYSGLESSPLIGPSSEWKTIYWRQNPEEINSADSTRLKIKAFDVNKNFQFEIDTVFSLNDSILNLTSIVDANGYPFIQLEAYYHDDSSFTPAQVDRWHVLFSPLPEAAIDGKNGYYWSHLNDTLNEGETAKFAVDVKNIFTVDMDSLLINYWVEGRNQVKHPVSYPRQKPLLVNEIIRDTVEINTTGLGGLNSLWMEVNPYINGSLVVTDQPEQEHFNNLLQLPFYVAPDDKHPILDVTFNGRHILNGDIIDPNSEILISLKDDNEYLIMDNVSDTSLFGIYLTSPDGVQKRIPFVDADGNTVMQWIPAEAQHKRFKIVWPSEFTQNGTYELFVQGSDRSGNLSGDLEYRVSFEVVLESTITHMMNYPNPFTTSTRFVFTLTGSEAPDDILIQILTVSGKVVREINEDELGTIHIGRNITEFAWDGTDEFGDPLANGVYLYRVQAKLNGETIKHRESGADKAFTKNFGKMYLMR